MTKFGIGFRSIGVACLGLILSNAYAAGLVKVTPLGGQDGEFCALDRALIFEDPNGTRILYDPGRTVAGTADARLGKIDVILVSHMHGDHVGDKHTKAVNAGECGKPDMSVNSSPETLVVQIAIAKSAKIITGSEMPTFFAAKLKAAGGDPSKSVLARFGATVVVNGIGISTVPAAHSNGIDGDLVGGQLGKELTEAGLTAYAGPPTGYVLKFSNGLVTYLSGDTGIIADQKEVIGDYYKPKLAVMNIGDTYTAGPKEAAFVTNEWIKPTSVIPSHANEAATQGGKVLPNTRTATFIKDSKVKVYVPLSGKEMDFDSDGQCEKGCS
jgi:L-ascorbate metabolism protein UlaG (beta-lactamase superfamily)